MARSSGKTAFVRRTSDCRENHTPPERTAGRATRCQSDSWKTVGLKALVLACGVVPVLLGLMPSGSFAQHDPEQCYNGRVVPDPDKNPGLVRDCMILLEIKDELIGDGGRDLDWSTDRHIDLWEGIWDPAIFSKPTSPEGLLRLGLNKVGDGGLQLRGVVPPRLGELAALQALILENNALTGGIPEELGNLTRLENLNISRNPNLRGAIPKQLGKLKNLKSLNLHGSGLTGTIPRELGELAELRFAYLYQNELEGEIPVELGELRKLEILSLYKNKLSGSIPAQFGNLRNLRTLALDDNRLVGKIPPQLSDVGPGRIVILSISRNDLTGEIPPELGRLVGASRGLVLDLSHNDIRGTIPRQLGGIRNLENLLLHHNRIEGCIPPELARFIGEDKINPQAGYTLDICGEFPSTFVLSVDPNVVREGEPVPIEFAVSFSEDIRLNEPVVVPIRFGEDDDPNTNDADPHDYVIDTDLVLTIPIDGQGAAKTVLFHGLRDGICEAPGDRASHR